MQLPRRFLLARIQGRQHPEKRRPLRLRSRPETLCRAAGRIAKVANPANRLTVGKITEVTHQRRHAALVGVGETDHLFNLRPLLLAVGDVQLAPLALADTYVLGVIEYRTAVDHSFSRALSNRSGCIRICFCRAAFSIGSGRSRVNIASSTATAG